MSNGAQEPKKDQPAKTVFELIIELVKAIAWPIFAIVVLILFIAPLRSVANELPSIVGRAETITVGDFAIKVGRRLRSQASDTVAAVLAKISPDGIRNILNLQNARYMTGDASYMKTLSDELLRLGLAEEVPTAELNQRTYGIRITALGREVQGFLLALIGEFVQELAQPDSTTVQSGAPNVSSSNE